MTETYRPRTKYYEVARDFQEFSKEEVDIFIDAFEEFDIDGSGAIDAKELIASFNKMGQGLTEQEAKEIIKEVDTDKSGQVEWNEYLAIMRSKYPWKRIEFELNFLIPARNFPEFSKGDIQVFVETFREFDIDGSGSIDARELGIAFQSMGQGISSEEVDELIEAFDSDHSGEIEFGEFLAMMRMFYPEKRVIFESTYYVPARKFPEFSRGEIDAFISSFKEFDLDGSGSISANELTQAFKQMGQGASPSQIQEIIDRVDVDGSGEIEWPEFLEIMRGFYPEKLREFEKKFYGPARKFLEFSRADVNVFIEAFREFDLDGSGSIDAKELYIAFRKMGQGCTEAQVLKIIDQVDEDGSGEIEWPEFLTIMRLMYPDKQTELRKKFYEPAKAYKEWDEEDVTVFVETFREFDTDGSGSVDARELAAAFKSMGQGCSPSQLKAIIDEVDDNGNGEIEWTEFLKIMHKLYSGTWVMPPDSTPAKAPAKTTTSAPAKSTTSSAPAKSTTSTSSAPAKSTTSTSSAPAKSTSTTSTSSAPAKSTSTTSTSNAPAKSASTGGALPTPKCPVCGKSVYPIEEIKASDQSFHKGCFKCSAEGCGTQLNLKNFKSANNKIYCVKHVPELKPTSTGIDGNLTMRSATSAPKLSKTPGIKKDSRTTFGPGELKPLDPPEQ